MIMEARSRRLSTPLHWGRREKTAVAGALAALLIAALALAVYGFTSGGPARADCVKVSFASTLGNAEVHACGARAKRMCASGSFRSVRQELQAACRRAGFRYTPPG